MKVLKDIAAAMDCHPKTAVRWVKKLDRIQRRRGHPRVCADVTGHGPNKWEDETFDLLIALYKQFYKSAGTTPEITRLKYCGDLIDARQIEFYFHAKHTPKIRIQPRTVGKTHASPKAGCDGEKKQARPVQSGKGRATAAR
ncbi:MAG TPA: hypothetical protein VG347_04210 [Verrucomicrobiae bacterium]|nr:hypothetical protein [Verrucomicrobiae bacterium]